MTESATGLSSMTGYARIDLIADETAFTWELKSVNGRGLEIRTRLPAGFDGMEPDLRRLARDVLSRGNCQFALHAGRGTAGALLRLNEGALALVVAAVKRLAAVEGISAPTADGILAIKGVLEESGPADFEAMSEEGRNTVSEGFGLALDALVAARREEGRRLAPVLADLVKQIRHKTDEAARLADGAVDGLKTRIAEQVSILADNKELDTERLHAEAVALAIKSDVREEVDRLRGHVDAVTERLASGSAIGRRLDFLAQEMNREANTICAKAVDRAMTAIGLDLKTEIDRFREQAQNIE